MSASDHRQPPTRRVPNPLIAALLAAAVVVATACSIAETGGTSSSTSTTRSTPNFATVPTLAGGVDLALVQPANLLVGTSLAFGTPLPSEAAAADAFSDEPEVAAALSRRVYSSLDGRFLGLVAVFTLDGHEVFDRAVLSAFIRGVVASLGDGTTVDVVVAGHTTFESRGGEGLVKGFLEGNQLVVVQGSDDREVEVVVERQLAALAAKVVGSLEPATPLLPSPIEGAFVSVPTVTFEAIPPPDEEPAPAPPELPGASAVEGRYGVVAGERRTTVWAFQLDPRSYPTVESLTPALAALVSARAGGAPTVGVEVIDRVIQRAAETAEAPSVAAFVDHGIAVLVQGDDQEQVDAVVSDWIVALSAP